jgi:hypothetical protein
VKRTWSSVLLALAFPLVMPVPSAAQDSIKVWQEFVSSLKAGTITVDRIRPYEGLSSETLLGWLALIGKEIPSEQLSVNPEVHRVGDHLHYLVSLEGSTFCFTFLIENHTWYFRHLENIFIRLDRIDSLPTSQFPDIPEEQKAWMREEIFWSQQVHFYNLLTQEKGKDFALNRFKDGGGYFLAAKTWVPFVPAPRAFVLYACWEQANLRGNSVVLERLGDHEAVIRFPRILYFDIYERAAHLKPMITFEDYRGIFEAIWRDRAVNAGWNLEIEFAPGGDCVFHLTKP